MLLKNQQVNHSDRRMPPSLQPFATSLPAQSPFLPKITAALETFGLLQGLHSPFLCSRWDV